MGQLGLNTAQYTHSSMKFLVLSALVAVSSCQLVAYHNGAVVPVDAPAVVAAKAAHAAAGGAIHAPVAYAGYAAGYPYGYAGYPYGAPVHAGFAGLVAHPNGAVVPVEPADVVAARAEHLAAKAEA